MQGWYEVQKRAPERDKPVFVWFRGKLAVGKYTPTGGEPSTHDWIVFPFGGLAISPYPQHHPKWWQPFSLSPEETPIDFDLDVGEPVVRWRGSVSDLYTDLFSLLDPEQRTELGTLLIGQPGGHVDRRATETSGKQQAASSDCLHCKSPDGHCPQHRPDVWKHRKRPDTLEELVRGGYDIHGIISDLKKWLGGDGDWWRAFQYEMGKERQPPVPMLLRCPSCNERHVDVGAFATKPHHTHACQVCGECWRPAVVDTVGVQFLPGFKNEVTP